jgi:hypothetical protein
MLSFGIIVASLALTVYASLSFADKIHERMMEDEHWMPPVLKVPTKASVAEKRRVLERARKECFVNHEATGTNAEELTRIDQQLLALADEEARIQE